MTPTTDSLGDSLGADCKSVPTWEARIYIGSRERYEGASFTIMRVLDTIANYQRLAPEDQRVAVRVTPTTFLFDKYCEDGWEVGIIQYPRFPKYVDDLREFTLGLARYLLDTLHQCRVSVVMADEQLTVLLTADGVEE